MIGDLLPLTDIARWAGATVLLVAVFVVGRYTKPTATVTKTDTDTVRVERPLIKRDTVTETVPRVVRKYDTVRVTDTVEVPVPSGFEYMGAVEPNPVDVTSDKVTLTYLREGRYYQHEYSIPEEPWTLAPTASTEVTPAGLIASAGIGLTYKTVTVSAGYEVTRQTHGWTVGVTWTPFSFKW